MRLGLVSLTFVFFLAACSHQGTDWERPWEDAAGNTLHERVISTVRGSEHCDWESAVFLYLGWPLGTRSKSADDARQYLRDPDRIFSEDTAVSFESEARLPAGARDSGYRLEDYSLWVAADAGQAVYLIRGSDVERWPRAKTPIACA
jgi:hypothetical protein